MRGLLALLLFCVLATVACAETTVTKTEVVTPHQARVYRRVVRRASRHCCCPVKATKTVVTEKVETTVETL